MSASLGATITKFTDDYNRVVSTAEQGWKWRGIKLLLVHTISRPKKFGAIIENPQ